MTGDLTIVGELSFLLRVKIFFGGISPKEEVGEGTNGRFDCETVGVGPEVTEGRIELEPLLNAVKLEHEAVEPEDNVVLLCTELIEINCLAGVTVGRDSKEGSEALALTRDCCFWEILMSNKRFGGKKLICEKVYKGTRNIARCSTNVSLR